jgi:type IV pilus assembly protein PilC
MLVDIAVLCERQVDERIGALTSLCEPLVVIVLGGLVGALVVAMYLPIIQLGNVVV